jgi:hypothetical protein
MSAVIVIGVLLLSSPGYSRGRRPGFLPIALILPALVLLALPTPFVWFDSVKNPRVWDVSASWPQSRSIMLAATKAIPTLVLYIASLLLLLRDGGLRLWAGVRSTVTDLR